jgi:hypothetical protein
MKKEALWGLEEVEDLKEMINFDSTNNYLKYCADFGRETYNKKYND